MMESTVAIISSGKGNVFEIFVLPWFKTLKLIDNL